MLPAVWACVSKQAVMPQVHKRPTEPPFQLPAPIRFAYTFRTKAQPRQRSERKSGVEFVRLRIEPQGGAVLGTEGHSFHYLRRHPGRCLYRLELIEREPPDPRRSRSDRKVHRAGERTYGYVHASSGCFEPGVDRFSLTRLHPKRQPAADNHDAQIGEFEKPSSRIPTTHV